MSDKKSGLNGPSKSVVGVDMDVSGSLEFSMSLEGESKEEMVDVVAAASARPKDRHSRQVRFSDIVVREYPIILGDNPGGSKGPPLSIGWSVLNEVKVSVDKYEEFRPIRRTKQEMIMPDDLREDLLRQLGYSRLEIQKLTKPVNIARAQRRRTIEMLHMEGVHALTESVGRKARNMLSFGKSKRKEKELLRSLSSSELTKKVSASEEAVAATDEESEGSPVFLEDLEFSESSEVTA